MTTVGLIILQKDVNNKSSLWIYMTFILIIYVYSDQPNLVCVTMYCYIHVRCICCYNMYPCIADGGTRLSGGRYLYLTNAVRTTQLGIYIYTYTVYRTALYWCHATLYTIYFITVNVHCTLYRDCNLRLYYIVIIIIHKLVW